MPYKLNDLTREELAQLRADALAKKAPTDRRCEYCGKLTSMGALQRFCSANCRSKYHNEVTTLLKERFTIAQQQWQQEREELVKEIAELKRRLGESS